jgi:hypothetical protein
VGKESPTEHGLTSADSAIPGEPHAQQIHHTGESRAAHFPQNAHSLAAAMRRVVAARGKLPGSETSLRRIRNHGEKIRDSRPAMLVEVQDIRTKPWGYAAREILQFLVRMDYLAIAAKGALLPIPCSLEPYDANLVALPIERTEDF